MTGPVTTNTVKFNLNDSLPAKTVPPTDKTSLVTKDHFQTIQSEKKRSAEKPKKPSKADKRKSILTRSQQFDDPRIVDENSFNGLHLTALGRQADRISAILESYPILLESTTKEGYTPLLCAAIGGSLDAYVALVKAGANCKAKDKHGRTILHLAVGYGHPFLIHLILAMNKELLESRDLQGLTPLLSAALYGKEETYQVLKNAGANENAVCLHKRNVLHTVLEGGHNNLPFISNLLKTRRDLLESLDAEGLTPLLMAAWCAEREVYELVLKAGGNDKAVSFAGRHVLLLAMKEGTLSTVEFLIDTRKELINARDKRGYTPLLAGAENGSKRAYEKLVQAGGDPNAVTYGGHNVLHVSAMQENIELLAHLIETRKKELLESRDNDGLTPLLVAAWQGKKIAYRMLLNAGANDQAVDNMGRNVFHCASFNGRDELIQLLIISNKEFVNSVDNNGDTPLMHAVVGGHVHCCRQLLEAGASFMASNKEGKTALKLARENGKKEIIDLLEKWQGTRLEADSKSFDSTSQNSKILDPQFLQKYRVLKSDSLGKLMQGQLSLQESLELQKEALQAFSELPNGLSTILTSLVKLPNSITILPNQVMLVPSHAFSGQALDHEGLNELHKAARDGLVDKVRTLISTHQHLLFAKSSDGKTALHWSAFAKSTDAYVRLLDAGLDPKAKDNEGYTILHLAVLINQADLVIFLLETQKQLLEIQDNEGNTPLLLAAGEGRIEMLNRLVVAGANLDARNAKGRNALHKAFSRKQMSLAQRLITLRSQLLDIKDNDGCTPLKIMQEVGASETSKKPSGTKEAKETKRS